MTVIIVEVKIGFIVVLAAGNKPIVDTQGQTLIFYRLIDAERWVQERPQHSLAGIARKVGGNESQTDVATQTPNVL